MKFLICHILRIENDKSERKKIMPKEKDFIEKTFEEIKRGRNERPYNQTC